MLRSAVRVRTITIHCTVRTRLFPVAFYFLPTALVTSPRDPSPLLHGHGGLCGLRCQLRAHSPVRRYIPTIFWRLVRLPMPLCSRERIILLLIPRRVIGVITCRHKLVGVQVAGLRIAQVVKSSPRARRVIRCLGSSTQSRYFSDPRERGAVQRM